MKCLNAHRDARGGWLNCDQRTHFAASTLRPGWAYELRYCPECYEKVLGLPAPPKVNRGELPHFLPLDIKPKGTRYVPTTTGDQPKPAENAGQAFGDTVREITEALA